MAKRKSIKVTYSKIKHKKALGLAYCENWAIVVDERLRGKKLLEILLHESLHCLYPEKDETTIETESIVLTNMLWKEGFRKIDGDSNQLLQDGKK